MTNGGAQMSSSREEYIGDNSENNYIDEVDLVIDDGDILDIDGEYYEDDGEEDSDGTSNGGADNYGTIVDPEKEGLTDDVDSEYEIIDDRSSFIDREAGDIVVMDKEDDGEYFSLDYIDIANIAVVKRVRTNRNVDDLVKSIRSTGLLEPVVVAPTATDGIYVLLAGFRRLLACAKVGKRNIPCVINNKVRTPDIPILESIYNHRKAYNMKEIIDYIEYLEKEKGIMSPSMIEFLLQLDTGDYTKLKDILNDGDDDIISRMMSGHMTIAQAFKRLEQRRKNETKEEKDLKKVEQVYEGQESGAKEIEGSGEQSEGEGLTDEEIKELAISATELDDGLDEKSLYEMVEEGKNMQGFEAHKQKVGEREFIDPVIRKTVLVRDKYTCACCKRGGESFVDALDYHHILPVMLGGADTPENGITLCLTDHRLVHLYAVGDLYLPPEKTQDELDDMTQDELVLYKDEQMRFKRIVKLGTVIREGIVKRGMKREQYKKANPIGSVGRNKPGRIQEKA